MEEKSKIYYPSLDVERKTKVFNKYKIPFVSFISMFTVSIFIGGFIYAFVTSFLNMQSAHLLKYVFVPMFIFVLSIGRLIKFLLMILTSYKIEDNKITKGIISRNVNIDEGKLGFAATAITLILNARMLYILKLIKLNLLPEFAETFFDTPIYRKKEYLNPKLIKETNHFLIYMCDNNKKLKIPKIYQGLGTVENEKGSSFIARIIKSSIVVFLIALVIVILDIRISNYKNETEYAPKISAFESEIENQLEDFGYSLERSNCMNSSFEKEDDGITSSIKYTYDSKGNLKKVDAQLYYNAEYEKAEDVEDELRAIINSTNSDFDEAQVDEFIDAVTANLSGEYETYTLSSKMCSFRIGRSGDYIDIH